MNTFKICWIATALTLSTSVLHASQMTAVPQGWDEQFVNDQRIVSTGNYTITVGPWLPLQTSERKKRLESVSKNVPAGGSLVNSSKIGFDKANGIYTASRIVRFGEKVVGSGFLMCPGNAEHARFVVMETTHADSAQSEEVQAFVAAVCMEKFSGTITSTRQQADTVTLATEQFDTAAVAQVQVASLAEISEGELKEKNQQIPSANRPAKAYAYMNSYWSGFPSTLKYNMVMVLEFPSGLTIDCTNLDPLSDIDAINVKVDEKCTVPDKKSHTIRGFEPGARVDVSVGKLNTLGIDGLEGGGTSFSGKNLKLDKEGRIAIGQWHASTVSSVAANARYTTSTKNKGIVGRYYLDGHTITIITTEGETIHGFIGYSPDDEKEMGNVYFNGVWYY